MTDRVCPTCAVSYQSADYGGSYYCKPCMAVRMRKYREKNPDRVKETNARSRAKNPENAKAWTKAWCDKNAEYRRAYRKAQYAKNKGRENALSAAYKASADPDHVRELARNRYRRNPSVHISLQSFRRGRRMGAIPAWADEEAIQRYYDWSEMITDHTGVRHEVDHIVPMKSDIVCGLHWHGNLQVITRHENRVKKNVYWPFMPDRVGA